MKKNLIIIGLLLFSGEMLNAQNTKSIEPEGSSKESKIDTIVITDCSLEVKAVDETGSFDWKSAKKIGESSVAGWRLPNKSELNCLFKNKDKIGGFKRDWYWSSDQVGEWNGWVQSFSNGKQFGYSQANSAKVRCVRTLKK
jgi:hypothetical protein